MRQIELATLMGLRLTDSHETDQGRFKQTYRFGKTDFSSGYNWFIQDCEDEVARDFFRELQKNDGSSS